MCAPTRNTPRTGETCQDRQIAIRAFVDRMFEDDEGSRKRPPLQHTPKELAGGGKYDPALYELIKRKRQHHKAEGTIEEFDESLRKAAENLDRKKAA